MQGCNCFPIAKQVQDCSRRCLALRVCVVDHFKWSTFSGTSLGRANWPVASLHIYVYGVWTHLFDKCFQKSVNDSCVAEGAWSYDCSLEKPAHWLIRIPSRRKTCVLFKVHSFWEKQAKDWVLDCEPRSTARTNASAVCTAWLQLHSVYLALTCPHGQLAEHNPIYPMKASVKHLRIQS